MHHNPIYILSHFNSILKHKIEGGHARRYCKELNMRVSKNYSSSSSSTLFSSSRFLVLLFILILSSSFLVFFTSLFQNFSFLLVSRRILSPSSCLCEETEASSSPSPAFSPSHRTETSEAQPPSGLLQIQEASSDKLLDRELNQKSREGNVNTRNKYSKLRKIEARLAQARSSIKEASKVRNLTSTHQDPDYVPRGPVYTNANAFHRSYLEMEKVFKIYVYEEGEPPLFHDGPCKDIYSTEGRFIHEVDKKTKKKKSYITDDPDEALVYFLPFSVVMMVEHLFKPSGDINSIRLSVIDYVQIIANRYPFWNRSMGLDHFMLSCHDYGPRASSYVPQLFYNSIRVLCNANTSEGFNPSKDVSLPEINLQTGEITGLLGGYSPSRRNILAFFAGGLHGDIRYILLQQWKNKDQDVEVYDELPQGVSYYHMLRSSRFCLCPSGYEVASPRVVEAIFAECVPVLISDSYVPPFSDVLNWRSFSVQVDVKDIPNIKKILMGISQRQYLRMQRRVKLVQRHFVPNDPPKRFDVFHMTIHSIWLRRLNIQIQDQ